MNQLSPIIVVDSSEDEFALVRRTFAQVAVKNPLRLLQSGQAAIDYLGGTGEFADRTAHPLPLFGLLELKLPGSNGLDVLIWQKNKKLLPEVPLIIYTHLESPSVRLLAEMMGAKEFVTKPTNSDQLTALLRDLAMRWGAAIG